MTDSMHARADLATIGDADLLAEFDRRFPCPDTCGGNHGAGDWDHAAAVLEQWRHASGDNE